MLVSTPLVVVVKALCVSSLVGGHARGFSYALMEKRRLAVCLVKELAFAEKKDRWICVGAFLPLISFEIDGFSHDFRFSTECNEEMVQKRFARLFYCKTLQINKYLETLTEINEFFSNSSK